MHLYYEIASDLPTHMALTKSLSAGRQARKDVLFFEFANTHCCEKIPVCRPAGSQRRWVFIIAESCDHTEFPRLCEEQSDEAISYYSARILISARCQ